MAKIYRADGTTSVIEPKNGNDFELQELHDIVGGYIEIVQLNERQIMVVNEEGKLHGLEYNHCATELMRDNIMTNDFIVGDVLVCDKEQVR